MANHLLNFLASNLEVLSGVECLGLSCEYAADTCGHCKTDVGVDVDLTNRHLSCASELLFGNTYCIGKLTAESVDLCNAVGSNGGCAVKNDGEAGKALANLFKNVETERRRNKNAALVSGALLCSELVCAVRGTDGDSKRVNAGTGYELLNLLGLCVRGMLCNYVVLNACENAKLTLNYNAVCVSVLNNLLGEGNGPMS